MLKKRWYSNQRFFMLITYAGAGLGDTGGATQRRWKLM